MPKMVSETQGGFFYSKGWCRFEFDPELAQWVGHALPVARKSVTDPCNGRWLRCGGTWFAGVNALPNDEDGVVGDSGPLRGMAVEFVHRCLNLTDLRWDRGQVSVCYPGYPQPMACESAAAFRYRRDRDAAHVDGLLPEGENRRRHLREHHGFILGIPMVETDPQASPFVVWEGSHEVVRTALRERFGDLEPEHWGEEDVTEVYHETRRQVFTECPRTIVNAKPGEAYVVHRLSVHGVAPWTAQACSGVDGRMICYFRPVVGGPLRWLDAP